MGCTTDHRTEGTMQQGLTTVRPAAPSRYTVRFSETPQDLDLVLRLRFDVFNLELGEGLDSSYLTERDRDEFDAFCSHLIVQENTTGEVVGTYRMQTFETAQSGNGFYSADEFDLNTVPADVLSNSVEIGRACIHKKHRNGRVLFLLWKGLAQYLIATGKRYLFGCCSLTSQDPQQGRQLMTTLQAGGYLQPHLCVLPQPEFICYRDDWPHQDAVEIKIPQLFQLYLDMGAKVCGPPAIDRRFKTIDYLVLLDTATLERRTFEIFFK